jgi:Fe-S cluster assembly protein SufD
LKRSSRFEAWNVLSGGQLSRFSSRISLNGENGEALLQGIWMLNENHQAHTHVVMDHHAPHCHSLQKFKGVMADISQASFEGKILVRQPAQKTEAYQLNNNLILGDHAIAYSKPNLEIFADDVKASHGATVTQIDEEQLFYLNSRGIGSSDAKKLLVQGFCREIIDQIPFTSLREQGGRHVENCLM